MGSSGSKPSSTPSRASSLNSTSTSSQPSTSTVAQPQPERQGSSVSTPSSAPIATDDRHPSEPPKLAAARAAIEQKDYRKARDLFLELLAENHNCIDAMRGLAQLHLSNVLLVEGASPQQRRANECEAMLYIEMIGNADALEVDTELARSYRDVIVAAAAAEPDRDLDAISYIDPFPDSDSDSDDGGDGGDTGENGVFDSGVNDVTWRAKLDRAENDLYDDLFTELSNSNALPPGRTDRQQALLRFAASCLSEGRQMMRASLTSTETIAARFLRFATAAVRLEAASAMFHLTDRSDMAAVASQSIAFMYVRGQGVDVSDVVMQTSANRQAIEYLEQAPYSPIAAHAHATLLNNRHAWYAQEWEQRLVATHLVNEKLELAAEGMHLDSMFELATRLFNGIGVSDFHQCIDSRREAWKRASHWYGRVVSTGTERLKTLEEQLRREVPDGEPDLTSVPTRRSQNSDGQSSASSESVSPLHAETKKMVKEARDRVKLIETVSKAAAPSHLLAHPALELAVHSMSHFYQSQVKHAVLTYLTYHATVKLARTVNCNFVMAGLVDSPDSPLGELVSTLRAHYRPSITHHDSSSDETTSKNLSAVEAVEQANSAAESSTKSNTGGPAPAAQTPSPTTNSVPSALLVQFVAVRLNRFFVSSTSTSSPTPVPSVKQRRAIATALVQLMSPLMDELHDFALDKFEEAPVDMIHGLLCTLVANVPTTLSVNVDADETDATAPAVSYTATLDDLMEELTAHIDAGVNPTKAWATAKDHATKVFALLEPGQRTPKVQIEVLSMATKIQGHFMNDLELGEHDHRDAVLDLLSHALPAATNTARPSSAALDVEEDTRFAWAALIAVHAFHLMNEVNHTDDDVNILMHARSARRLLLEAQASAEANFQESESARDGAGPSRPRAINWWPRVEQVRRTLDREARGLLKNLSPDFGSFARLGYHVIASVESWNHAIVNRQHVGNERAMEFRQQLVRNLAESRLNETWLATDHMNMILNLLVGRWTYLCGGSDSPTIDLIQLDRRAAALVERAIEQTASLTDQPVLDYARITYADPYIGLFNSELREEDLTEINDASAMFASATGDHVDGFRAIMLAQQVHALHEQMASLLPPDSNLRQDLQNIAKTATMGYQNPHDQLNLMKRYIYMLRQSAPWETINDPDTDEAQRAQALDFVYQLTGALEGRCPDGQVVYLQGWTVTHVLNNIDKYVNVPITSDEERTVVKLQLHIAALVNDIKGRFIAEHLTPFRHGSNKAYEEHTSMQLILQQLMRLPLALSGGFSRCKYAMMALPHIDSESLHSIINVEEIMKRFLCGGSVGYRDVKTYLNETGELVPVDAPEKELVNTEVHAVTLASLAQDLRSSLVATRDTNRVYGETERWRLPRPTLTTVISSDVLERVLRFDCVLAFSWADFQASFKQRSNKFFDGSHQSRELRDVLRDAAILRIFDIAGFVRVPADFYENVTETWTFDECSIQLNLEETTGEDWVNV